jgi:hypothetical protein
VKYHWSLTPARAISGTFSMATGIYFYTVGVEVDQKSPVATLYVKTFKLHG